MKLSFFFALIYLSIPLIAAPSEASESIIRGFQYTPPEEIEDDEVEINPLSLKTNLKTGIECGEISIEANVEGAINNVIENAKEIPRMISRSKKALAYMAACNSPYLKTACESFKALNMELNAIKKLNFNRCELINKYSPLGSQEFKKRLSKCIQTRVQANKGDFPRAEKECNSFVRTKIQSINNSSMWVDEVHVLRDSAVFVGLKEEQVVPLCTELVGETVVSPNNLSVDFKKERPTSPIKVKLDIEREVRRNYCLGEKEAPKSSILKGLNIEESLSFLEYLPESERKYFCYLFAEVISTRAIKRGIRKCFRLISPALQNPNLTGEAKKILQKKYELLEKDLVLIQKTEETDLESLLKKTRSSIRTHKKLSILNAVNFDNALFERKLYKARNK